MGHIWAGFNVKSLNTDVLVGFILMNSKHPVWIFLLDSVVHFASRQWREEGMNHLTLEQLSKPGHMNLPLQGHIPLPGVWDGCRHHRCLKFEELHLVLDTKIQAPSCEHFASVFLLPFTTFNV